VTIVDKQSWLTFMLFFWMISSASKFCWMWRGWLVVAF
jgi:hypothetical protein